MGRRLMRWCLTVAVCAGCVRPAPLVPPRSAPPPPPELPGLSVLLTWTAPVDLDLYLTDPTSETVYFANTPSRSGARLVRDARCGDVGDARTPFVEVANFPEPLPGRYRVGVDFIDTCAEPEDQLVSFRVTVRIGSGQQQTTGTIRLAQFQPIVLEFELQRVTTNGPLMLLEGER